MRPYQYHLVAAILLFMLMPRPATGQEWVIAGHAGGGGNDYGDRITVDRAGNSYVVGVFSGTARFDTITVTGTGRWNLFAAKYSPAGAVRWARLIASANGPTADIFAGDVAVDAGGNIVVGGRFLTEISVAGISRESRGSSDMYLIKLDSLANVLWVRTPGGIGNGSYGQDGITGIALDSAGNCLVTGHYNTDAQFDSLQLHAALTFEMFVAKFDADGHALWALSGSGESGLHLGLDIAADPEGNAYLSGRFFNKLGLGSFVLDAVDAEQKAYLAKVSGAGQVLWAHKVGDGGYYGFGEAVAAVGDGGAVVAGQFRSTMQFADTSFSYNNAYRYAPFVARYGGNGQYIWAVHAAGSQMAGSIARIAAGPAGSVLIVGSHTGTIEWNQWSLASPGDRNSAMVIRLNQQGICTFAAGITGTSNVVGSGIALRQDGTAIITGTFGDTATIGTTTLQSNGGLDAFIAAIRPPQSGVTTERAGSSLGIAPNPADEIIHVRGVPGSARLRVIAIDGRTVIDAGEANPEGIDAGGITADDATTIDIQALPDGVYLVTAGARHAMFIKHAAH